MAAEKTVALVIRTVDFSETSKIVTFFSRDHGKLGVMAKGARRLKSAFEVALDLLSLCSICVLRKPSAELDLLTEASLLERFAGLRTNLAGLYGAYYIAELLDGLTQPHQPHPKLFDATVEAVRQLAERDDRFMVLCQYQLFLLKDLGYAPNLERCVACGAAVARSARMAYSISAGGLLCSACERFHSSALHVQGGTIQAMRLLQTNDAVLIRRLVVAPHTRAELWRIISTHVRNLLGRTPRTAALLQLEER